ncbi:unnamed protein product [Notodromas monacha]|uniref:Uncharacterized protein n=1 Tax=Notodromas monacha TaxID=399045 RepID=A0A7R9GF79_9CRUS|nr:unnamed protein product [Notodromas monacha]CAG0919072.1 unnamed protein product [Notodromas monacha]
MGQKTSKKNPKMIRTLLLLLEKLMVECWAFNILASREENPAEMMTEIPETEGQMESIQRFPGVWTDEGQYLVKVLGDPLVRGLTEISKRKPNDPVAFLASFLHGYAGISTENNNHPNTLVISEEEEGELNDEGVPQVGPNEEEPEDTLSATSFQLPENFPNPPTPSESSTSAAPMRQAKESSTARDERGQTVLHHASSRPHGANPKQGFKKIIDESNASLAARDERYQTCRDVARAAGVRENVAAIDDYVVNLAAEGKRSEIYHLLMEGYDHIIDVKNLDGLTAYEAANKKGQDKTVELLSGIEPFSDLRNILHSAIRNGDLRRVKETLTDGASQLAIAKSNYGRTALHIATLTEYMDIVEFLVQNFPETVSLQDNMGRTAMHYAMGLDKVDQLAKILVKGGARKPQDYRGRVPSYYFLNKDEIQMLKEEEESLKN